MTNSELLKAFLAKKSGRCYLSFCKVINLYKITGLILMLILTFVLLAVNQFSGQFIIACVADAVGIVSCVLLTISAFRLMPQANGQTIRFDKTIATIHLAEGLQLFYTPFMVMVLCLLMAVLDAPSKVGPHYDYVMFRTAWEIYGLCAMICAGTKLAVCHMLAKHAKDQQGHPWLLLLMAGACCLPIMVYVVIVILFQPELSGGVWLRICFIPVLLHHAVTAAAGIHYWQYLHKSQKQEGSAHRLTHQEGAV